MDITETVKKIAAEQLDLDAGEINEGSIFIEDLGADSLALTELVLAFEEQFSITIPDEVIESIQTIGDAVAYIRTQTA